MTREAAHDTWMRLLQAAGVAEAAGERLDGGELAAELHLDRDTIAVAIEQLERAGLLLSGVGESARPMLLSAGRQFLTAQGDVAPAVLSFLPSVVDDLHAREALLQAGVEMVARFRTDILAGEAVQHAADLVPPAFVQALDEAIALNLFAAAVALMARLSAGEPAGCVAEEIVAVRLMELAAEWLEAQASEGALVPADVESASDELRSLFDLFQDDDVLRMFDMAEPGDAAVAEHDDLVEQMGVADQRLERWFEPFGGTTPTGYLSVG